MSSPTTTPRRTPRGTPKRTPPRRNPLQERTSSQKNEAAGRPQRDGRAELTDAEIFGSTPFPTKPQHVFLPSTIRKQKSRQNVENELPELFFNNSAPDVSGSNGSLRGRRDLRHARRPPNLQLKKSVTALRDMYEAQAEVSRPTTAVRSRASSTDPSTALRPSSGRLRSVSSSEGLSGRSAWEMLGLPRISGDDLSALPTLSENAPPITSDQSFASRARNNGASSSPNYRTFGSSSPKLPSFEVFDTSSDPTAAMSNSLLEHIGSSSPNLVTLQHTSSDVTTDPTPFSILAGEDELEESSPNVLKLGTTSPRRSSSPTPSNASTGSRKRKYSEVESRPHESRRLTLASTAIQTSPAPHDPTSASDESLRSGSQVLPSSPPEIGSIQSESQIASSPIVRIPPGRLSNDGNSLVSAHANLQSVLSSSPGPPVHRPIVRAPDVNQFEIMAMQKRNTSGQSNPVGVNLQNHSSVSSVTNVHIQQIGATDLDQFRTQRNQSRASIFTEELEDSFDTESVIPAQAYMVQHDLNSSRDQIISDADYHEAADELSALPHEHSSFAAVLGQVRSNSFLGSGSSSASLSRMGSFRESFDERFQSMRSLAYARSDSLRSSYRPASSGSYMSTSVVPTWARGYYSGFYRNSFHYLYQSSSNLGYSVTQVQPQLNTSYRPASVPTSSSYETISNSSRSTMRRSLSRSVRSSMRNFVPSMIMPHKRARLDVRQSHLTAGVGPLVSNPVRPVSETLLRPPSAYTNRQTIRRLSVPLSAADPRYHWNGIAEEAENDNESDDAHHNHHKYSPGHTYSSNMPPALQHPQDHNSMPLRYMRLPTPHLHQDRRLHTGSSASQGYGAPYNFRPKWQPTEGQVDNLSAPSWYKVDLRDLQVICFMVGFLLPFTWFIGAFSPLPTRPKSQQDPEKMEHREQNIPAGWDDTDVLARLRLERHLSGLEEVKWQNARWWRRMNRWMCCVGLVVLAVVIVLAVLGTKSHWA